MKIKYLKDKCIECGKEGPCAIIYGYAVSEKKSIEGQLAHLHQMLGQIG